MFKSGDILFIPIPNSIVFAFSMFSGKSFTVSQAPPWAKMLDANHINDIDEISAEQKAVILEKYQECVTRQAR